MSDRYYHLNIREYLEQNNPEDIKALQGFISDFTCPRNPDVERFLKNSAVEFTKKSQSVMYLVFSSEDEEKLLTFYRKNNFQRFETKTTSRASGEAHELVQMLRML